MALTYNGKANFRNDGDAVNVVVPAGASVVAGNYYRIDGWAGVAMESASQNEVVALDISGRVWEVDLGGTETGAKGTLLYLTSGNVLTSTATGNGNPVAKVWLAKDTKNIAWVKTLENR